AGPDVLQVTAQRRTRARGALLPLPDYLGVLGDELFREHELVGAEVLGVVALVPDLDHLLDRVDRYGALHRRRALDLAGTGARKHHRPHLLWKVQRDPLAHATAHRVPHDEGTLDAQ